MASLANNKTMNKIQKNRLYRRAYEKLASKYNNGGPDMFGWFDWHTIPVSWKNTLNQILTIKVE